MIEPVKIMLIAVILEMALYFVGEIDTVVAVPVVYEDKIIFVDGEGTDKGTDEDANKEIGEDTNNVYDEDKYERWETSGLFEGDMLLTADQRNGILDERSRWPNNTIPYELDPIFGKMYVTYQGPKSQSNRFVK